MPKRIHWDNQSTTGRNARAQLPPLLATYYQKGRKLLRRASAGDMHAFRLTTKRLRYTLEMFRPCYGAGLEQRLEALRKNQTLLGDLNDCAATRRLLAKSLGPRSPQFRRLERFLNTRAQRLTVAFRKHWREKFDAPGGEQDWIVYLARGGTKGRMGDGARKRGRDTGKA